MRPPHRPRHFDTGPRPRGEIRWGPILAVAAAAYLGTVAVARPDFLRGMSPVLQEPPPPPKQPVITEELFKDPKFLKQLREFREQHGVDYAPPGGKFTGPLPSNDPAEGENVPLDGVPTEEGEGAKPETVITLPPETADPPASPDGQ